MTDPLEAIIRPIVEGQIRGFIKEHPSVLKGVDWYRPRDDKAITLTNSLAKRIIRDLTCPSTRGRLVTALLANVPGSPSTDATGIDLLEASTPEMELRLSRADASDRTVGSIAAGDGTPTVPGGSDDKVC